MTSSLLRGYDSAYPIPDPPNWEVVLFYIWATNTTPHIWTDTEIDVQPARYRVPTAVCRLDPSADNAQQGETDAAGVLSWLAAHRVPKRSVVCLDTETLVLPAYVAAFNQKVTAAGYTVLNYGSLSYVVKNPATSGGRFSADWRDIPQIDAGSDIHATQYADASQLGTQYDASLYSSALPLWDKEQTPGPPTPVPPAPVPPKPTEVTVNVTLPQIGQGAGMTGNPNPDVKTAQALAGARGHVLTIDGRFGQETADAIREIQGAAKITVDGIVGPETWPVLLNR